MGTLPIIENADTARNKVFVYVVCVCILHKSSLSSLSLGTTTAALLQAGLAS